MNLFKIKIDLEKKNKKPNKIKYFLEKKILLKTKNKKIYINLFLKTNKKKKCNKSNQQ